MAGNSDGEKKKRGRPASRVCFAPKPPARKRKTTAKDSPFGSRTRADDWMRAGLATQVEDYDFMIAQLRSDFNEIAQAMREAKANDQPVPTELLRARQSTLASMRTLMAGKQELMLALLKTKKLLNNLAEEDVGGDLVIQVTRLPDRPPQPVRDDLPPDDEGDE